MKVCRVCLSEDHYTYYSLFSIRDERTIAKTIMLCTGLKIKRKDGLTQLVCGYCTDEFLKFFKLRQQCLDTDAHLRKDLQSQPASTEVVGATTEGPACEDSGKTEIAVTGVDSEPKAISEEPKLSDDTEENKPEVEIEEWVIEEIEIVKAEYEDLQTLDDASLIDPQENSQSSPGSDDETKIGSRTRKKRRASSKGPRKRKSVTSRVDQESLSKFICCSCPTEAFESQQALELHRADQHEKYRIADNVIRPFECDVCFQRFLTEKHLTQHKERPYKKREYVCTSCGNAFLASSTLKKHEEICVTTERNYACEECGKRFTQVGSLRNHLKLHNSEKTHPCPICDKTFLKKFEVSIHMVTHTEEQPFPCDQCPARFKRKQALRNHQRHHSNPMPYKCELCDEWFNNFSARKFHRQKVHEGIEPFKCDQCDASYGRKNRLEQHKKRVHTDEY